MSKALADMLGFNSEGPYSSVGIHHADHVIDLDNNLRMLYVYSDIASFSLVGDTKVPLLRVNVWPDGVSNIHPPTLRTTCT